MKKIVPLVNLVIFVTVNWFFLREVLISSDWKLSIIAWLCFLALFIQLRGNRIIALRSPPKVEKVPSDGDRH